MAVRLGSAVRSAWRCCLSTAAKGWAPPPSGYCQRLLVDYLFRFTTAHRLEAGTDVDNIAEQKALERIGFTREGVLREAAFRDGARRDSVIYALLRDDWQGR